MARVEIPIVVLNSDTGLPVDGASVAISSRATGQPSTWWTQETGGTSSTAAVTTDSSGRVEAWVDRGAYNLGVSGTGINPYTVAWEAVPAGNGTIDMPWLGSDVFPPGLVMAYGGNSSPNTAVWLICDGSPVSRTTYQNLYNIIGNFYGAGDGSTTFNVPDLRGRVPVGKGAVADGFQAEVSERGRTESGLITDPQLAVGSRRPKHRHTMVESNHTHPASQAAHAHTVTDNGHGHGGSVGSHSHSIGGGGGTLPVFDSGGVTWLAPQYSGSSSYWLPTTNGYHAAVGMNTDAATPGLSISTGYASLSVGNATPAITVTGASTGVQAGPQSNSPTDGPAYQVVNFLIKV